MDFEELGYMFAMFHARRRDRDITISQLRVPYSEEAIDSTAIKTITLLQFYILGKVLSILQVF